MSVKIKSIIVLKTILFVKYNGHAEVEYHVKQFYKNRAELAYPGHEKSYQRTLIISLCHLLSSLKIKRVDGILLSIKTGACVTFAD